MKIEEAANSLTGFRLKRLMSSISAGVIAQFASLLGPIIILPAMLQHLGPTDFGIWMTTIAFVNVAVVLDLGIGNAILTKISDASARGDLDVTRRYLTAAYRVLSLIAILGFGVMGGLSYLDAEMWFPSANGWLITVAVVAAFLVSLPLTITYKALYALRRIPLQSALQVCGAAVSVIVTLLAIRTSSSPGLVVLSHSFAPMLVMFCATVWLFMRYRHLAPRRGENVTEERRALFQLGGGFLVLSLLTSVGMNADLLLISFFAGPEATAEVVPPIRIGTVLLVLVINLFLPLWTFNGEALARGELAWVKRNTIMMSIGGALLVSAGGVVALVLLEHIMQLWMGRSFEGQTIVLAGMVLLAIATAITAPFNMVLNAMGRASVQVKPWAAFVLTSLLMKALLISKGNVALVPACGALAYFLTITPFMIREALKALKHRDLSMQNI